MKTLIASLGILIPVSAHAAPATATKPLAVCVAQATGTVTARAKCKTGERPLSLATVAASAVGPQGPQGPAGPKGDPGPQGPAARIEFSTCYTKSNLTATSLGMGAAELACDNVVTDFMLTDGIESTTKFSFVNQRKILFDAEGKVPVGVRYYLNRETFSDFVSTLTVVCCKR